MGFKRYWKKPFFDRKKQNKIDAESDGPFIEL